MADINALLAQGVALPQIESPVNQFARLQALRSAQQEQQLNALKLQEAQTTMGQQEALRNYLAGATDYTSPEFTTGLTKFGTPGLAVSKALIEQAEAATKAKTAKVDLATKKVDLYTNQLKDIDTPEAAANWVVGVHNDEDLKPYYAQYNATTEQSLQTIPKVDVNTPEGKAAFDNWKLRSAMGAKDFASYIQQQATLAETKRHNEALEANARARFEAEREKGEYTPETIDYLANIYNQTGQLPALGLGASAIRGKIFERARQIGMAPGAGGAPGVAPTAAEAAANVAQARQTRAAEQSTLRAFSSGLEGRRVTANNTAINHLETMDQLVDDLANPSNVRAFNAAASAFAKQTGATAPTNFDAARQIVAQEVIKAVVQNGGGVTERQEAKDQFSRANTPEQLRGVINTYRALLGGQLQSLKQQYESGTGRKDFDNKLTPNTRKLLSPAAAAAPAAGAAAGGGVDTSNPLLK